MYNGIGLATARGSGTNGYVQRNWAAIKKVKDQTSFKTDEELAKIDSAANRQPNQELLDHDRKRKVELKCIELEQSLEDQGYSQDEIIKKINTFRQTLLGKQKTTTEYDECGRPIVRDSHQLADEQLKKNARLREAFGISEFFIEGSSLDPERKIKEAALAQLKAMQVDQALVQTQMNEDTSTNKDSSIANELQFKSPKHKKRKKKKSKSHKSDKEKGSEKKKSKKHRRKHNSSSEDSPRTDEVKANKNSSQVKSKNYDETKKKYDSENNHKKHKKDNDKILKNYRKEIEFKYKSDREDYHQKDSGSENSKSLKKDKITEEFNKSQDIFYDSKKQENSPRHKTPIKDRDRDRERDYDKYKQHTNRDDSKSNKEKSDKTDSKYNSRKRNSRSPVKELKKKSFKPDKLTCIPVDSDSDKSCYTPPPKSLNAKLSQSKTNEEENPKSTKYTFSLRENSEDRLVVNKSNGCTGDLKSALQNSENQHNKSESHKVNDRIDQIFLDSTTSEEGELEEDIDLNIIKEITTEKIKKVFELHEKQEQALLHLKKKLMEKKRKVKSSSSSSESSDEPVKKKSVKRRRVKDSSSSNSDVNIRKKSKRSRSSSSSSSASDTSVDHHKSLKRSKDKKYSKKKLPLSRRRTKDSTSRSRSRSVSVSSSERLRKKRVSSSEDSSPRRKHKSAKRKRSSWRQRSSSVSSISSRSSPSYSNKRRYSTSRSRSTCSSSSSHYSRSSSSSRDSSSSRSSRSSKSRSASIPRRRGSPSFLDRRRITSARKRPIPYTRLTPFSTNSDTDSVISVHDSPIAESH